MRDAAAPRFYSIRCPKHNAFNFNRLTPQTLRTINDTVIQAWLGGPWQAAARHQVVQPHINLPTDNSLSWDAVRVVTCLVRRLGEAAGHAIYQGISLSPCSAR
jgi:hypothetical protein